jgi:hypothetical protein
LIPLPQCGPYEALEGIYPGRAGKNWGWARVSNGLISQKFDDIVKALEYRRVRILE